MAEKTIGCAIGFRKCAVCKIDLKGKFVYIDDHIEALLGCTKEELFGRTILDFLDQPSQDLINNLLEKRNHYESFFDSTEINLVNSGGKVQSANIIVSLNFIAGNPVNFQLICDIGQQQEARQRVYTDESEYKLFLDKLDALEGPSDLSSFIGALREFAGAAQASVYLFDGENLEPRAGVTDEVDAAFTFKSIPEPDQIHFWVAATGIEYSFADQQSVQVAVEAVGQTPQEFISVLQYDVSDRYLVRMIFPDDLNPDEARECLLRARLGLRLADRYLAAPTNAEPSEDEGGVDVKFTIGFLDTIGIGAMLIEQSGQVVGYNPSMENLMSGVQIDNTGVGFLTQLQQSNRSSVIKPLLDNFAEDVDSSDISATVTTPSGQICQLSFIKFGSGEGDRSGCLVLTPTGEKDNAPSSPDLAGLASAFAVVLARTSLLDLSSEAMAHELYEQLGENGDRKINDIRQSVTTLQKMVREISRTLQLCTKTESKRSISTKFLFEELLREAQESYPDICVQVNWGELPGVVSYHNRLKAAFADIISQCFSTAQNNALNLNIEARDDGSNMVIAITDDGTGIPQQYLKNVMDFFFCMSESSGNKIGNFSTVRYLIESIGGTIDIDSDGQSGTVVTVSIPNLEAAQ